MKGLKQILGLLMVMLVSVTMFGQSTIFKKLENQDSLALTEGQRDSAIFYTKYDSDKDGTMEVYQLPYRVLESAMNIFRTEYGNVSSVDSTAIVHGLEVTTDSIIFNSPTNIADQLDIERGLIKPRLKYIDKGEYTRYTTALTTFNFALSATVPIDEDLLPWRYRANKVKTVGTGFSEKKVLQGYDKSTSFANDHDLIFEFNTDADSIELGMLQNSESIYIVVKDSVYKYNTTFTGSLYYTMLKIPYFDSTSRLVRVFTNNLYFRGLGIRDNYVISSADYEITASYLTTGDSFVKGNSALGFGIVGMLSYLNPSIDFYNNGVGATGYVDPGFGLNIPDRLVADIAVFSDVVFDGILCFAGFNDAVSDIDLLETGLSEVKTIADSLGLQLAIATSWPLDYASQNSPTQNNLDASVEIITSFVRANRTVRFLGYANKILFETTDGTHPTFFGAWEIALYFNKSFN